METVGEKIIEVRKRKGWSQESLAEKARISLRTVQRIENNEVEPRGHTLSSICDALEINIEDVLDYGKVEDKSFFCWFHLSVALGIVFPLGDIILPFILWLVKKDKIIDLDKQGKNLLVFRVIYNIILFSTVVTLLVLAMRMDPSLLGKIMSQMSMVFIFMSAVVTLFYPIFTAVSIYRSKELKKMTIRNNAQP